MGQSVLVFISHSSGDKESLIEPIVSDLEECFINVWIDKRKIVPGDNLRKSIFRDGLDKADVVLIFFTKNSLSSAWVDREIKHVLREETKKGNNFDLNKIISIFDSTETYNQISDKYPELTDDLLHLLPENYTKIQFGQLVSAIWSKYFSLQGNDVTTQRQILEKDKELFQKEKEIQELKLRLQEKPFKSDQKPKNEFSELLTLGILDSFIKAKTKLLSTFSTDYNEIPDYVDLIALGLLERVPSTTAVSITSKGKEFFKWYVLETSKKR